MLPWKTCNALNKNNFHGAEMIIARLPQDSLLARYWVATGDTLVPRAAGLSVLPSVPSNLDHNSFPWAKHPLAKTHLQADWSSCRAMSSCGFSTSRISIIENWSPLEVWPPGRVAPITSQTVGTRLQLGYSRSWPKAKYAGYIPYFQPLNMFSHQPLLPSIIA